ncbi:MAG: hypothetical protein FWD33_02410 [Alphaproteobacteria bacterium]|nr:hypothetical protein [Alphaproteobacteria bacterium]
MAYQNKNMSVIAYANGFTLWHYAANDPIATVNGNGYFIPAISMIKAGDMLLVSDSNGGGSLRTFRFSGGVPTTTALV